MARDGLWVEIAQTLERGTLEMFSSFI